MGAHRSIPLLLLAILGSAAAQSPAPPAVQHGPNFDAERAQANELFLAHKPLEALPLYENLCRQDSTVAVFQERRGAGLLAKEATVADPAAKARVHADAIAAVEQAQKLGDNSAYVAAILGSQAKTPLGAITSSIPLSSAYTYKGNAAAQDAFQQGEAAFGRAEPAKAVGLYVQAAQLDPAWYAPAVFAGDMYFRLKDLPNASTWFARAVAIDPDAETAYRYWGDALYQAGDAPAARDKFVQAVVAEPYSRGARAGLQQWAQRTGHRLVHPAITIPPFTTANGVLQPDPALAASNADGRSSWLLYQQYRVAHGATTLAQFLVPGGIDAAGVVTPSGYEHTVAEEHAALRTMLADTDAKLTAGTLTEAALDPSIRNLRGLEKAGMLGAWIALEDADAGIRQDYPRYRAQHRRHLVDFVNSYLIQ